MSFDSFVQIRTSLTNATQSIRSVSNEMKEFRKTHIIALVLNCFPDISVTYINTLIESIPGHSVTVQAQNICDYILETNNISVNAELPLASIEDAIVYNVKTNERHDGAAVNVPRTRVTEIVDEESVGDALDESVLEITPPKKAPVMVYDLDDSFIENELGNSNEASGINQSGSQLNSTFFAYECKCCYNDVPFEYMIQCLDGHVFCCLCFEKYTSEVVYGQGNSDLKCMSDGCKATYPRSQLMRALPNSLIEKLENRVQEEAINMAAIEDFERCIQCGFGAILHKESLFFQCTECSKVFCRKCKADYKDHVNLTCSEVEGTGETVIRLTYEERMAEATIRKCYRCKAAYTKDHGCNLIHCRCRAVMCYVCREPIKDYTHFCHCQRGKAGTTCSKCRLCGLCQVFSENTPQEVEAIENLRKEANNVLSEKGYVRNKMIGAPAKLS